MCAIRGNTCPAADTVASSEGIRAGLWHTSRSLRRSATAVAARGWAGACPFACCAENCLPGAGYSHPRLAVRLDEGRADALDAPVITATFCSIPIVNLLYSSGGRWNESRSGRVGRAGGAIPACPTHSLEHQRSHAGAFVVLARYTQPAEPRPSRKRASRRGEPRVTRHRAPAPLPVQQSLEGAAPARAQGPGSAEPALAVSLNDQACTTAH
jgi:hypothetical protein